MSDSASTYSEMVEAAVAARAEYLRNAPAAVDLDMLALLAWAWHGQCRSAGTSEAQALADLLGQLARQIETNGQQVVYDAGVVTPLMTPVEE